MNTPPDFLPPDEVDVILAAEAWEETAEFRAAVREWMLDDEFVFDVAVLRFSTTDDYDRAFIAWLKDRCSHRCSPMVEQHGRGDGPHSVAPVDIRKGNQ